MELTQTQNGILEDSYWTTFHGSGDYQIFQSIWNSDSLGHDQDLGNSNSSAFGAGLVSATEPESGYAAFPPAEQYAYLLDGLAIPADQFDSPFDHCKHYHSLQPIPFQEKGEGVVEDPRVGLFGQRVDGSDGFCKVEKPQSMSVQDASLSKMDSSGEQKIEAKKVVRQPSKNLMAERRRRKRLNDRLSMLRSMVPKISKMDRTSILGGTIDYIKDLMHKINKLREESMEQNTNQIETIGNLKELKPDEVHAGKPPKFDVERRSIGTRIDLCCTSKPGLLLSTVSTLEALGLDIQQCVISCFNDFSVQATCSEVAEHRRIIGSEDVKQALVRNACHGGRCL